MAIASDDAIDTIREVTDLGDSILPLSSYGIKQKTRRWIRYPSKLLRSFWFRKKRPQEEPQGRAFVDAAEVGDNLMGQVRGTANQLLASIGYNQWVPKIPGQKGLRLSLIHI